MSLTHARNSVAYAVDGTEYATDTPLTRTTPRLTNALDISRPTGEGTGSEDVIPWAARGDAIFGRNTGLTRIYKLVDGSWSHILTGTNIGAGFVTAAGSLIYLADATNYSVYRATESAGTWSAAKAQNSGDFTLSGTGKTWFLQGVYQRSNGTIIWGEYATATMDLKIHRSTDDGANWTTVYTFEEADAAANAHCHTTYYDETNSRWMQWWGDGTNRRIIYSADDGENWSDYTASAEVDMQPIRAAAYGSKIIHGSDESWGVYSADYSGGPGTVPTLTELIPGIPRVAASRYCFQLDEFSGTWIASGYDTSGSIKVSLWATKNPLGEWAAVYRFPTDSAGMDALYGPVNGYLYGREALRAGGFRQIKLRVPTLVDTTATEVWPACTNLMTLAQSTQGTGMINQSGASLTMSTNNATEANHGTTLCARLTRSDGGEAKVVTDGPVTVVSSVYYAVARTRAARPMVGNISCTISGTIYGLRYGVFGDDWTEWHIGPMTAAAANNLRIRLEKQNKLSTAPATMQVDLRVDSMGSYLANGPRTFTPGATTRAADILSETQTRGASWSETFYCFPRVDSDQIAGDHYLFSYSAGDSSVSLYIGTDDKYKLVVTVDGVAEDVVESAATWFLPGVQLKVTATLDDSGTTLTIDDGGDSVITLEGAAVPDLLSTDVAFETGDTSGANVLPMAIHQQPAASSSSAILSSAFGFGFGF